MLAKADEDRRAKESLSKKYSDFDTYYDEVSKFSNESGLSLEQAYWVVWGREASDPEKQKQNVSMSFGSFRSPDTGPSTVSKILEE